MPSSQAEPSWCQATIGKCLATTASRGATGVRGHAARAGGVWVARLSSGLPRCLDADLWCSLPFMGRTSEHCAISGMLVCSSYSCMVKHSRTRKKPPKQKKSKKNSKVRQVCGHAMLMPPCLDHPLNGLLSSIFDWGMLLKRQPCLAQKRKRESSSSEESSSDSGICETAALMPMSTTLLRLCFRGCFVGCRQQ